MIAAVILLLAASPSPLRAESVSLTWSGGIYPYSLYQQTIAWIFTANTSVDISALDWFDRDGNETVGHTVDLWDDSGNLLATACVGPGCLGSTFSNQYWSTPVDVLLAPGTYVIGGWEDGVVGDVNDRFVDDFTDPVTPSNITYVSGIYEHSSSLTFPTDPNNEISGIVGPNFEDPIPSPEPSSLLLLGAGLLALMGFAYHHKRLA